MDSMHFGPPASATGIGVGAMAMLGSSCWKCIDGEEIGALARTL